MHLSAIGLSTRLMGVVSVCAVLLSSAMVMAQGGVKTVECWKAVRKIQDEELGPLTPQSPLDKQISALRNVSRRIDGLSARGVDQEVIEISERAGRFFKRAADCLNDYGDNERGFKSGLRDGLNGNPTRGIEEQKAVRKEMEAVKEAATKVRKKLESKYDVDLPPLFRE